MGTLGHRETLKGKSGEIWRHSEGGHFGEEIGDNAASFALARLG